MLKKPFQKLESFLMQARHLIFSLPVHPGSAKKQRWPAMTL
jgi:hypothetical protein